MKRVVALSVSCLVLALLIVSCASKPDEMLVGKWQETTGKETIEFLKDKSFQGTLVWDLTKAPVNVAGKYTADKNTVTLTPTQPPTLSPMTLKVEFSKSGKELTITYQQGGAIKLDGSVLKYQKLG